MIGVMDFRIVVGRGWLTPEEWAARERTRDTTARDAGGQEKDR